MLTFIQKHPLTAYFVLALALSWLVELPLVAVAQGWVQGPVPYAIHYLAAFGPMLSAVIVTGITGGAAGLKELLGRITRWRVGTMGLLAAVLSPVALFALAVVAAGALGAGWPDLSRLSEVNYLPNLGVGVLLLWLATYGFGEEIGWRGFALPRLQNGRSALSATLILWALWALWHVPTFFYLDTYVKLGLAAFPMFALGVLCGAIILTWLYNTSRGSVLMVAVWHAIFDLLSAAKVSDGPIQIVMSILVMIWAVAIVVVYKPAHLSRLPKHTLGSRVDQPLEPVAIGGEHASAYR